MKHRPEREDYRRWLDARRIAVATDARESSQATDALPELPAALPFTGYVVWFHVSHTYLDIRFDHNRFAIVTKQVENPAEAFYFDHLDAAYGHAVDVGEPCLVLFTDTAGGLVSVVG